MSSLQFEMSVILQAVAPSDNRPWAVHSMWTLDIFLRAPTNHRGKVHNSSWSPRIELKWPCKNTFTAIYISEPKFPIVSAPILHSSRQETELIIPRGYSWTFSGLHLLNKNSVTGNGACRRIRSKFPTPRSFSHKTTSMGRLLIGKQNV